MPSLKLRKLKGQKKNQYKQTKDSFLLTFSTHRENKPFEVGAEPTRLRAKCTTSNGNKTSLPGAVAVLKSLFAKGPFCVWHAGTRADEMAGNRF